MPLAPLAQFVPALASLAPQDFADRHATEDVILVEPYEKERDYHGPLHEDASYLFVPRAEGQPIPVGRDERASVQVDHAAISRLHLVLAWSGRGWQAMDRSSNGSWLDGERLPREQAVDLPYGVPVRLGRAIVVRLYTPLDLYSAASEFRPARGPALPAPPELPFAAQPPVPQAPRPPQRPIPKPPSDEIEMDFEVDFDMGGDGRGGFA